MVHIVDASAAHAAAIQDVYAHHVLHGVATFETVPPSVADMAGRVRAIQAAGLPWLVAEDDGEVVGYAYLGPYRTREAYRSTLENSVYLRPAAQRRGVGRALMAECIVRAEALGYRQIVAVVGDSQNAGSVGLHKALGFRCIGTLEAVGFKHGRWLDTVFLQLTLGEGDTTAPHVRTK
ncbi:N-acetyltransferase [Dipodascopsis tothii]|uniref:N-acetyltransferase n=1 Tax=Dipodascopsis tothii TaxID=44089 RepID=UPI0034CF47AB